MSIGSALSVFLSFGLNALVIFFVLTAPRPRYLRVVWFCSFQILAICATLAWQHRLTRAQYIELYWTDDLLAHCFILLLIFGLIGQAMAGQQARRTIVWGLVVGVLVFALGSAYAFYSPHLNHWIAPLSRNMSFCEEVLNFVLWGALIQKRESDTLLFMVSAGIGVQVTGEAIGHTLRLYSHNPSTVWVPTMLVYLSEILCLIIWIWAFYSARNPTRRPAPPNPTGGASVDSATSRGSAMA